MAPGHCRGRCHRMARREPAMAVPESGVRGGPWACHLGRGTRRGTTRTPRCRLFRYGQGRYRLPKLWMEAGLSRTVRHVTFQRMTGTRLIGTVHGSLVQIGGKATNAIRDIDLVCLYSLRLGSRAIPTLAPTGAMVPGENTGRHECSPAQTPEAATPARPAPARRSGGIDPRSTDGPP